MRKSAIAAAIPLLLGIGTGQAAQEITVTKMEFYDAAGAPGFFGGGLNTSVAGSMNDTSTGVITSNGTPFFGTPWTAVQGAWFDSRSTPLNWSGTSASGAYSYNFQLTGNQVAAGMLFTWGAAIDIAVLQIFDCGPNVGDACVGVHNSSADDFTIDATHTPGTDAHPTVPGSVMGNGPFAGQHATFHGILAIAPNQPPVATDDTASTTTDTSLPSLDIVANDTDNEDGAPPPVPPAVVNLASGTTTLNGTVTDNGDGTVNYTPPAGVSGVTDTFQYTLTDSGGTTSNSATVSITISATANTPPVANDLNVVTDEDTPLVTLPVSNDTDADGDTLSVFSFDAASAQGGAVTDNGSNALLYTPPANFSGSDSYGYVVTDGNGGTDSATVFITINAVNDGPVCTDVSLNTAVDTALDIDVTAELLSTCSDVENDPLSLDGTTQPSQGGALSFDGANTLTYTPASGFIGEDTFTYTVTDGTATNTNTATVGVGKIYGNFTMLGSDGSTAGGTNDILFTWDGTCYNSVAEADAGPANMTMGSDASFPFFGFSWFAKSIKVYCPGGPYVIDTCNPGVAPPDCGPLELTVPAGHLGGHMLFDWNVTSDIDVAIVWNNSTGGTWQTVVPDGLLYQGPAGPTPALDEFYEWISVDGDGDGIPGIRFTDGPFIDFRANFNFKTTAGGGGSVIASETSAPSPSLGSTGCTLGKTPATPLDRSDWLIIAGLITWLGFGCRRRRLP